jgi:hypothetical protein
MAVSGALSWRGWRVQSTPALSNPGRLTGGPVPIGQVAPKTKASRQLPPRAVTVPHPNETERLRCPKHHTPRAPRCCCCWISAPLASPCSSFCVRLPLETVQAIDRLAADHSANRATIARNLLSLGLQSLKATADN